MGRLIWLASLMGLLISCAGNSQQLETNSSATSLALFTNAKARRDSEILTLMTPDGVQRSYLLRLPANYQSSSCVDVLFDFHGAGDTAVGEFSYSGFAPLADREGFILVHPDANKVYVDQDHRLASYWNSAWEANLRERDYDIDFVLQLVELIKSEHCSKDFFATGMSAGGDMVSALACLAETPFKAFASVTYRYYNAEECGDAGPRPILSFQGDADRVVPIDGFGEPWFDPPMVEIMRRWSAHNQCQSGPMERRISDEVVHYAWSDCAVDTEWYLIEGGSHTWPGGAVSEAGQHVTQDISASELIWAFFRRQAEL